jgi:hypothetical protein
MLEITLSNGRTIQCLGLAAQHRALLQEILVRTTTQQPSPPLTSALLETTPETVLATGNLTLRQGQDSRG